MQHKVWQPLPWRCVCLGPVGLLGLSFSQEWEEGSRLPTGLQRTVGGAKTLCGRGENSSDKTLIKCWLLLLGKPQRGL